MNSILRDQWDIVFKEKYIYVFFRLLKTNQAVHIHCADLFKPFGVMQKTKIKSYYKRPKKSKKLFGDKGY